MKSIPKYFFIAALSLIVLSIIMFCISIGLFTDRGNYSRVIVKLGELSFVLWLPFLLLGILLFIIATISYLTKK